MARFLLRKLPGYLLAAVGFAVLLFTFASLCAPTLPSEVQQPDSDELAKVEAARDLDLDFANPPLAHRDVDYSEGKQASWWPKGESPIFHDLVESGDLPPVEERVGPEPCVMEGVDGIGNYGGVWQHGDRVDIIGYVLSYTRLFRFSEYGFPLVPHIARSVEVSPGNTEFTVHLRHGMRWSDGEPYTADDIMYWWEYEQNDDTLTAQGPHEIMRINGRAGWVEKIDDYTVKYCFPEPNGAFLAVSAASQGGRVVGSPEHYLSQYHPRIGNRELIERHKRMLQLETDEELYRAEIRKTLNPEHPRLWPWLYLRHSVSPPQRVVRNPYYFCVDTEGNQLPYIDEVLFREVDARMVPVIVSSGEVTMQHRGLKFQQYTMLMGNREDKDYDVYHWYPGRRSTYAIALNQTRKVEADKPATKWKRQYLRNTTFRQALSIAINREDIIRAEYFDVTEPANDLPGPASPFHDPESYKKYTEYDPDRANRMLDGIGLDQRDIEGFRTFPDGSRMVFFLDFTSDMGIGPAQFVVDDWAAVGVRVVPRERNGNLFQTEWMAGLQDMNVSQGHGSYYPMARRPLFMYISWPYVQWYSRGGMQGAEIPEDSYAVAPPDPSPFRDVFRFFGEALAHSDVSRQAEAYLRVQRIYAEQQWIINICSPPPALAVVKNGLKNVPRTLVAAGTFSTPANAGMETFFFEEPDVLPSVVRQIKEDIRSPTPPPNWPKRGAVAAVEAEPTATRDGPAPTPGLGERGGAILTRVIRWAVVLIVLALLLMIALRHPYIGRRLLIMIPTLLVVSIVVFVTIQLPPGDFLDSDIIRLQQMGDNPIAQEHLEKVRQRFWLDKPMPLRYMRWLGLYWFAGFDESDRGLLQGNMGRSMDIYRGYPSVNQLVGDRIVLTFFVSLGTILFTYAMSLPIGIYSAVRQYSISDYALTTIGFIGLSVPNFLLALLLMYAADEWLHISVTGLFSSEYAAQVGWSWGKVIDLLQHIWVPIAVLGVTGTAGGIRTMRANLLDELKKPYVVTARAKGVRPLKLLIKYPVRLALNPFVSGVGNILPRLVSGGAIVAVVLQLPTVGPLMLDALMTQDMYLAGSMLMVLSLLTVLGTLISDLLLLALDPRIRFESGTR